MKNLEIKKEIKKMSLANIDGKLTPEEMENIMAGSFNWGCAIAVAGLAGTYIGAASITAMTGGAGAIMFAGMFISGSVGLGLSCRR
jgi:hypothetical protein